jgi:hypothetical protein
LLLSLEKPSKNCRARRLTAAITATIEDFLRGEKGKIAGRYSAEIRGEFGTGDK